METTCRHSPQNDNDDLIKGPQSLIHNVYEHGQSQAVADAATFLGIDKIRHTLPLTLEYASEINGEW